MSVLAIRLLTAIAVLAAAVAAPSGTPTAVAGATSCATGMHRVTISGHPGFRFCGPASAVVRMGGRTLQFSNGLCRRAAGAFTVNIGTFVPSLRSGKLPYFGITTHTARAGTQRNAALGFTYRGRHHAIADQVVILAPGLQKGTFSGRVLASTTRVSGSFRC